MPTRVAPARTPLPSLKARDRLGAIEGFTFTTGIGCLLLFDTVRRIVRAERAAATSLGVLLAPMQPRQARLHELRGLGGAVTTAANLRRVIDGSDLLTGKLKAGMLTRCASRCG